MTEIRVLSASGQIGSGFMESSFERGISLHPDVIACDGGSTDAGPFHLGAGEPHFSREGTKRDLRLMMQGRARLGVPLIVGSCGMAGGDDGVNWMRDIALEIAREEGLKFRLGLVRSEQEKGFLKEQLREGRITPLNPAPPISESIIDGSAHIVAMMGHEPIAEAIEAGAEVIFTGRASDTALFAAVPLMRGADVGSAWHAAKVLECGTASTVQRKRPDSIFAWVRDDHFDIEPLDFDARCTPQSVASHSLYENADPFLITEPGGTLDTAGCRYEALNDRAVRVTHSRFLPAVRQTFKLEGAALAGYQVAIIAGIREPYVIRQIDPWFEAMCERFKARVDEMFQGRVGPDDYSIRMRVYGRDGVMGKLEPLADQLGHEVGVLFTIMSAERGVSLALGKTFAHFALHYPIPEWRGLISALAFPMTPAETDRGPVYRFNLNHIVAPQNPRALFRHEYLEVGQ